MDPNKGKGLLKIQRNSEEPPLAGYGSASPLLQAGRISCQRFRGRLFARVYDPQVMKGPLHRFFDADHRRLDALLERATSHPDRVDLALFGEFRAGLLKHIGMEEKVLFLAASRARGDRLPRFAKLRVDHGAIASLLVPTPTPALVAEIRSILGPHNRREEEEGGIYDVCDEAIGPVEAERLLEGLRHFPEVRLKGHNDAPVVHEHIRVNVELSRAQWREDPER